MSKEGIDHLHSLLRENADNKIKQALAWAKKYETNSVGEYDSGQIATVIFLYESVTKDVSLKIGEFLCSVDNGGKILHILWINDTFCFEKKVVYDAFKTWMKNESSLGGNMASRMNRKYEIMQEAACNGDHDMIEWLISIGVEVDTKDSDYRTALHVAAQKGLIDTVNLLLKNKASMFVIDSNRRRPIDLAYESKHFDICDIMSPFFVGSVFSGSKLVNAVSKGDRDKAQYISKKSDSDTSWNALKLAVEKRNADMVETIITSSPDIIRSSQEKKKEILAKAVEDGDMDVIEKLMAFGFFPDDSIIKIAKEKKMDEFLQWCECLKMRMK